MEFRATLNSLGRRSEFSTIIDFSMWQPMSVIRRGADAFRLQTLANPVLGGLISHCRKGLLLLTPRTVAKLQTPAEQLFESDILPLLRWIHEDCNADQSATADKSQARAAAVRKILECCSDPLGDGGHLPEIIANLLPMLRKPNRVLAKPILTPEISQLRHVDWEDLRQQTYSLVQQRRTSIDQAVWKELERYEAIVEQQKILLKHSVPQSSKVSIQTWLESTKSFNCRCDLSAIPTADIAASLLQKQVADAFPLNEFGWPQWDRGLPALIERLDGVKEYRVRMSSAPWSFLRYRLPNPVLTAIFIALTNHTGWNPGSVGELTADRIQQLPNGNYRIQGFKTKTDDDSPFVDVLKSHRVVHKAITLLLWNHQQLQRLGLINTNELRLWFGWQYDKFKSITTFGSSARVEAFCKRNNIPRFNTSELRPMAAAAVYLPQRDIEAVRILLGHKNLQTSDAYLKDTLFFRLNEANMLQFQRRIEASLMFSIGGDELVRVRRQNPLDIDPKLLVATGDGGGCTNPLKAPSSLKLKEGEVCPGLHCHQNGGCENYRLYVDVNTISVALRTQVYYRTRWSDLMNINLAAFQQLHLPRLIFIHVLLSVIQTIRPDLLRQARKAVE